MSESKRLGWSTLMFIICCAMNVALGGDASAADQQKKKIDIKKEEGMESFMRTIKVEGASISIQPGVYKAASGNLEVKTPATFTIDPAELVTVKDESIFLSEKKPESWHSGTPLAGSVTYGVNGNGCYVPGSICMRRTPGGPKLIEGKDYLIAPEHATVGLAPGSKLSSKEPVLASYQYSLLRLDTVVVDAQGKAHLIKGKSHVAQPQPPEAPAGTTRLLNIFRPYHARTIDLDDIYPILERPDQAGDPDHAWSHPQDPDQNQGQPLSTDCLSWRLGNRRRRRQQSRVDV